MHIKDGQINVGILGLGTVGAGTVQVLRRNADLIAQRAGCRLEVRRIVVKHPNKVRAIEVDPQMLSGDADDILEDGDIHIVAELIGGVEPARDYVLRAIRSGKSVVTANKELIAKHGPEIIAAADEAGVDFLFEGSVGGGIPLIQPLRESLVGNRVLKLTGIVNGTTNYILTRMTRDGMEFDAALAQAQALGYAEADPTADVDGYDAQYKLAILASIAFSTQVKTDDIFREGIRGVGARDIEYARELGYVIKLLAIGRQHSNCEVELRVHPALIRTDHPLAGVNDSFNAVLVEGDAVGQVMFYGRGAGSEPTGSAVVGDLVEVARNLNASATNRLRHEPMERAQFLDATEITTRFCIRMQVEDRPGAMAKIATIFGDEGVSIQSIVQKGSAEGAAEIFWMTHRTAQRDLDRSLEEFGRLDVVKEVSSVLRVEGD